MITAEWVSGNVFIRAHKLKKGEVIHGHAHNFDHTSIVFTGSVRVKATIGGALVDRVFAAASHCLIRKETLHEIEALEDSDFWCVYAHQTPQGTISQVYDGWSPSYE